MADLRTATVALPVVRAHADVPEGAQRPVWRQNLDVFMRNRFALVGAIVLLALILFSFVGPLVYRTDQVSATLLYANLSPSSQFPLGSDPEGYDMLGRLMLGGQSTLEVGFAVGILATGFGALWGALAGYVGGVVDSLMMRVVDTTLSIPYLLLAVLLATLLQPTLLLIILVISAVSWPGTARIVRGDTLSLRTRDYVVASRGFGIRHWPLIRRHIVPNALGAIIVNGTLKVATAILIAATLAFLGLGVPPPATTWGRMITSGIHHLFDGYWWELWLPAAAIVLAVIAVNAIGDGIYDMVTARHGEKSS